MLRIFIYILILQLGLHAIKFDELQQSTLMATQNATDAPITQPTKQKSSQQNNIHNDTIDVFGNNLFNGNFTHNSHHRYNPSYRVDIGDVISLKMWGAFDFVSNVVVDSKGNIFIPRVGVIKVIGIQNDKLNSKINKEVKRVFKKSVFVYATLESFQPVSIFVTGAVNQPGLYDGLSSDSIIQFIDKAKGINSLSGSYRNISVLRNNIVDHTIDLYNFILKGEIKKFQFRTGDVIFVKSVRNYIEIEGDVKRAQRFEIKGNAIKLKDILKAVLPNPTLTNFTVTRFNDNNEKNISIYPIKDNLDMLILNGESINFIPDNTAQQIQIEISGEHANTHTLIVNKGTTLEDVYKQLKFSDMSDTSNFQLFRKSIAARQKALIDAQLDDLAAKTLTVGSLTAEEALIRKQESALVLNFIQRAKKAEPKGQVVINKDSNLSQIYLEDGDNIFIPKKSNMVIVQGEVMLPGAQTYVNDLTFDDYITSCGGFNYRANTEQVLIIQKNGRVVSYDADSYSSSYKVLPGDSILVMGKVDKKYLQVIKDITQIVYQIAVAAGISIRLF